MVEVAVTSGNGGNGSNGLLSSLVVQSSGVANVGLSTHEPGAITNAKKLVAGAMGKPAWILLGFRQGPGLVQVIGTQQLAHVQAEVSYQPMPYWSPSSEKMEYRIQAILLGLKAVEGPHWTAVMDQFSAPGEDGW